MKIKTNTAMFITDINGKHSLHRKGVVVEVKDLTEIKKFKGFYEVIETTEPVIAETEVVEEAKEQELDTENVPTNEDDIVDAIEPEEVVEPKKAKKVIKKG